MGHEELVLTNWVLQIFWREYLWFLLKNTPDWRQDRFSIEAKQLKSKEQVILLAG
jgi:hypothetical protein